MFMMVDSVRGMTVKSCMYGQYGLFEYLLFLLITENLKLPFRRTGRIDVNHSGFNAAIASSVASSVVCLHCYILYAAA